VAVAISSAADWLPANIVRFYIHFSVPAETAFERSQLRLIAADGEVAPDPFLVLNEERWSPDGRGLTVLMDPRHIKRRHGSRLEPRAGAHPAQISRLPRYP